MKIWQATFLAVLALASLASAGQAVCTRSALTVLRKGPGKQFDRSWTVPKYMPFLIAERKGGWLKVTDMDGEAHWGNAGDFTQNLKCVVVKANVAETRLGPGLSFPYGDFRTLDRYTPLKRLDTKGDWIQVENDLGQVTWVQQSKVWRPVVVQTINF